MKLLRATLGAVIGTALGVMGFIALVLLTSRQFRLIYVVELIGFEMTLAVVCVAGPFFVLRMLSQHEPDAQDQVVRDDAWASQQRPTVLGIFCAFGVTFVALIYFVAGLTAGALDLTPFKDWQVGAATLYLALLLVLFGICGASVGAEILSLGGRVRVFTKTLGAMVGLDLAAMMTIGLAYTFRLWNRGPNEFAVMLMMYWLALMIVAAALAWLLTAHYLSWNKRQRLIGTLCAGGGLLALASHLVLLTAAEMTWPTGMSVIASSVSVSRGVVAYCFVRLVLLCGAVAFGWFYGAGLTSATTAKILGGRAGAACGLAIGVLAAALAALRSYSRVSVLSQYDVVLAMLGVAISILLLAVFGGYLAVKNPLASFASSTSKASGQTPAWAVRLIVTTCGILVATFILAVGFAIVESYMPAMGQGGMMALAMVGSLVLLVGSLGGLWLGDLLIRRQLRRPEIILAEVVSQPVAQGGTQRQRRRSGDTQP